MEITTRISIMQCYTTIFDCYEWLPPYGENHVSVDTNVVTIYYDNLNGETKSKYPFAKRSYIFDGISSFCESVFPGIIPMSNASDPMYKCQDRMPFDALFEINNSIFAKEWNEYWQTTNFSYMYQNKHLCQFFTTANTAINVICTGVKLTEETLLKEEEWGRERL